MKGRRTKWLASVGILIILILIGGRVYKSLYINLYGFSIREASIRNVVVYENQHAYYVSNPELVQSISREVSKMKRDRKINSSSFPQYSVYTEIPHFLIQTNSNASYGGNIWENGTLMDSNGYYWTVTPQLLSLLKKAAMDGQTKQVY